MVITSPPDLFDVNSNYVIDSTVQELRHFPYRHIQSNLKFCYHSYFKTFYILPECWEVWLVAICQEDAVHRQLSNGKMALYLSVGTRDEEGQLSPPRITRVAPLYRPDLSWATSCKLRLCLWCASDKASKYVVCLNLQRGFGQRQSNGTGNCNRVRQNDKSLQFLTNQASAFHY